MHSRVESNDHLNIALEIVVLPYKSLEFRVVGGLEKDEQHIDLLFCFYFSKNFEYEVSGLSLLAT